MKKLIALALILVAVIFAGVQAAHADGCCCDGSWNDSGSCE